MKLQNIIIIVVIVFAIGASLPFTYPQFYSKVGIQQTQKTSSSLNSENTQVFFCPQDNCAQQLVEFYSSASKSIHVMIYSLTKKEIADALIQAKSRGIEVKVLFDNTQAGLKDAKDEYLQENGIELKIVNLPGNHIFHNKISIIDGNAFSTGSFNYTQNADSGNAENLIIVRDEKLALRFEQEFQKYWSEN